jgi:hypothetical protein
MKRFVQIGFGVVFTFALLFSVSAQEIYRPEGINMPGSWNGWTNSLDEEQMGNFRLQYRLFGGGQYVSRLQVKATNGDVAAGAYKMLFTSGPSTALYQNKWADGALSLNAITPLVLNGAADNDITLENDFIYTIIYDDNGYANSRASLMRTRQEPVQVLAVSGLPTQSVTAGEAVGVNVELSAVKSPEEKVFLIYSINDFESDEVIEVTEFDGVIGSVNLPGQADGVTLSFFVITSTVDPSNWGEDRDMFTLDWNSNDGANYSVSFGSIATLISPSNNAQGLERNVSFSWSSIESAEAYQLQISTLSDDTFAAAVIDTILTDTTFSSQDNRLDFNTNFQWRVRKSSEIDENWSNVFGFKTRATIEFANLAERNWVINRGDSAQIQGKVYIPEITQSVGQSTDLQAWVGISNQNTDPSTWEESSWTMAQFASQDGNDDVFHAYVGKDLSNGTYAVAMRYQFKNDGFIYGAFSTNGGGFWNGESNVNGSLTVTQLVSTLTPSSGSSHITLNPTLSWQAISGASFDVQVSTLSDANYASPIVNVTGINDSLFSLSNPLEYGRSYRWRVRLGGATPGPFSESKTFKTRGEIGFFNLQFVENDTLIAGSAINIYSQLFINGYTNQATEAEFVSVWIGISNENTNPETWEESLWTLASLNEGNLSANNDEYTAQVGADLALGTYFVAARMAYLDDDYVYGGYSATGGGFWNETHSNYKIEVVEPTSVESSELIYQTRLQQNYPNPFNPSTTIPFELSLAQQVTITVIDVLGREVATLVNTHLPQGKHQVRFDASRLSSGLYFIRMDAGEQRFTKAITLLK